MKLFNPFSGPDQYSPKQLMVGAGLNTFTYAQWKQRRIIDATVSSDGAGTTSSYTFTDIAMVAIIKELKNCGIPMQKGKAVARKTVILVAEWQQSGARKNHWPIVYISFGSGGIRVDFDENIMHASNIRINLDIILNNVCGRIEEMSPGERKK